MEARGRAVWKAASAAAAVVALLGVTLAGPSAAAGGAVAGGAVAVGSPAGSPANGDAAQGELRVTTSPPVPSLISVDGTPRDVWGLTWLDIETGSHEVCFSDVLGFDTPDCQTVSVASGATTTVEGSFEPLGWLRVTSDTTVKLAVEVDGVTRSSYGAWLPIAAGSHEVCFTASSYRACTTEEVVAGDTTYVDSGDVELDDVPDPSPLLRVETSPAVASQFTLDGEALDVWGLAWMPISAGDHELCFSDVPGYETPPCQTFTGVEWTTSTVVGQFTPLGWLRATTEPPQELTIEVDGIARNDWGAWLPVTPGSHETCFVADDATETCKAAQVTAGLTTTVDNAPAGPAASLIDAGATSSCAVTTARNVLCWGNGPLFSYGTPHGVGLNDVERVSAGGAHICAVYRSGQVGCWGKNTFGQLGDGTADSGASRTVLVSGITTAVDVVAAGNHTCALLADGTVRCWGWGFQGLLGTGSTADSYVPATVTGVSNATALTAGDNHTCALVAGGTVKCWGNNGGSQLGDGTSTHRATPVTVSGITTAKAITAGSFHTCALLTDTTARCWGTNSSGQLGDGTTDGPSGPVAVSGLTGVTSLSAGGYHSCATLADGTNRCWGHNADGRLGDGTTSASPSPVTVASLASTTQISVGSSWSCALDAGHVFCWGDGRKLGHGALDDRSTPTAVVGL